MSEKVTKEIIKRHIAALSTKGGVSSYSDFYDHLLASLKEEGFVLSGFEERLMRKTLREAAPLGATDLDDRAVAALKEKPWYLGAIIFVALCVAGGIIEYFVQIPLDHLTGNVVTQLAASSADDGYRLAIAEESECSDILRQLVLNNARFELVTEDASVEEPHAIIKLKERALGYSFQLLSADKEKILAEGILPKDFRAELWRRIEILFPIQGYVVHTNDNTIWCDVGRKQGIYKGTEFKVFRAGKKTRHPVSGKEIIIEEEFLGDAFVVNVNQDTCKAKMVEPVKPSPPGVGDIVRCGGVEKAIVRPKRRKKMYFEFNDDKIVVRIEQRVVNNDDTPIKHLFGFEGTLNGIAPNIWLELDGKRGPSREIILNRGYQVQYKAKLPQPVLPGERARVFTCIEASKKATRLSDGSFRVRCATSNSPAIDYLIIAKLPFDSRFLRADMIPTRVLVPEDESERRNRPVVVFKTSQPKNHRLAIHIDYSLPNGTSNKKAK